MTDLFRVVTAVCLLPVLILTASESVAADHPNIVLFVVDDMGWQDTSVPFWSQPTSSNELYRTPNMERLSREGIKFTRAYAAAICSPTRISIMTGQNMARHRVTNWTLRKNTDQSQGRPDLLPPRWNLNGLQPPGTGIERSVEAPALPLLLQQAGYRTIHVGKAHLGAQGTPGADPLTLGFDRNVGGHAAGAPSTYLGKDNFSALNAGGDRIWDVPHLDRYHGQDIFLTEALTHEAIRLMDEAISDGMPFLLHLSHYAVHVPFAPDDRFIERYRKAGHGEQLARYAAMVEGMDKSLGDVMDFLAARGLEGETIVVFTSDNGGVSGWVGLPDAKNVPLRAGKGSYYEGGIRVPMIVRWPGNTPSGSICRTPVIAEDFYPTLVALAGGHVPETYQEYVDGEIITPLFKGCDKLLSDRPLVFHQPHQVSGGDGYAPFSAIVQGDWKLIYTFHDRAFRLYDLCNDIGESNNLAEDRPQRVSRMARTLAELLEERSAQCPVLKDDNPLSVVNSGYLYHNGSLSECDGTSLILHPGDEIPLLIPDARKRKK